VSSRTIRLRLDKVTYSRLQQLKAWLGLPSEDWAAIRSLINRVWFRYAGLSDDSVPK